MHQSPDGRDRGPLSGRYVSSRDWRARNALIINHLRLISEIKRNPLKIYKETEKQPNKLCVIYYLYFIVNLLIFQSANL